MRSARLPLVFKHDPDLPISARRPEILEALERHQVLIVAGDTGSGKSTQLPQYCLELGRGREPAAHRAHPAAPDGGARAGGAHRRGARASRWAAPWGFACASPTRCRRRRGWC